MLCSAFHARNLKYTAVHQQQYLIRPTNTQEGLNVQPSKKIWEMESDGSLASPLTRQGHELDKAIKQRLQSSHIPPCHKHVVIATNLSSLFDLLHCSIPEMRAECSLQFWGYQMFPGLFGSALPLPLCRLGVPCRRHPQFPSTKRCGNGFMADRPGLEPAFCGSVACVRGVFLVCYITITCVTVFQTTHLQNHFATLGLEPLTLRIPKTGGRGV